MGLIFKMIKMLLAVIIGIVYLPLNLLLLKLGEHYKHFKKDQPFEYWVIRILLFPLWAIVSILSIPYEIIVESAH